MEVDGVGRASAYHPITKTATDGSQQALFFRRAPDMSGAALAVPLTNSTPSLSPDTTGALLAAQEQTSSATRYYRRSTLSPSQTTAPARQAPTQTSAQADPDPVETAPVTTPTTAYARRTDTDLYSYRTDAADSDFAQASAIRSGLTSAPGSLAGTTEASQVDQDTANLLKKVAGIYDPDQTAGSGGTVVGLVDRGPASSTSTFNFALRGDTSNFALQADGDLGGSSLLDLLKNGSLQIDVEKWGGMGNAGANASKLSLSGSAYNVGTFGDGDAGTSNIRHNQTDLGSDTVGATFGGWSARDGLTFTVRSYDPSINISNLKLMA